jgi:hypothetical protein
MRAKMIPPTFPIPPTRPDITPLESGEVLVVSILSKPENLGHTGITMRHKGEIESVSGFVEYSDDDKDSHDYTDYGEGMRGFIEWVGKARTRWVALVDVEAECEGKDPLDETHA